MAEGVLKRDPGTWCTLTQEETRWTNDLKIAAHQHLTQYRTQILACSNLTYAQFAIVTKGNVQKGLKKLGKYVELREKYDLDNDLTLTSAAAVEFMETHFPDAFLPASGDTKGRAVLCLQGKEFKLARLKTDRHWQLWVKFMLDVLDASMSDLDRIRAGLCFCGDMTGIGYKNFSPGVERRVLEVTQEAYPVKAKVMYVIDAPFAMWAMLKVLMFFLSEKQKQRLRVLSREETLNTGDFGPDGHKLPESFGGTTSLNLVEWLEAQRRARQETEANVRL